MVTVDQMAQRYGLLPSEVLCRATTLDLTVMNVSDQFQKYRIQKQQGKLAPTQPNLTQEEMLAMVAAVKERKNA